MLSAGFRVLLRAPAGKEDGERDGQMDPFRADRQLLWRGHPGGQRTRRIHRQTLA